MIKMRIAFGMTIAFVVLCSRITLYGQCNPQPKADFRAYDVCEGDSVTFINMSQNAATYLWKFGDGQTSGKQSPKHIYNIGGISQTFNLVLIASLPNGCSDTMYNNVTVNANPISDFSFSRNGGKFDFTPVQKGNTKYLWLFGDGDSSTNYTVSHSYNDNLAFHTVCLKVTNPTNCSSETCQQVPLPTSISNLIKPNSFKIYPNPNSGSFTIEKFENKGILSIELFNQFGQIIYKTELTEYVNKIDLDLANGIYSVRFTNEVNSLNQRVVVTK